MDQVRPPKVETVDPHHAPKPLPAPTDADGFIMPPAERRQRLQFEVDRQRAASMRKRANTQHARRLFLLFAPRRRPAFCLALTHLFHVQSQRVPHGRSRHRRAG